MDGWGRGGGGCCFRCFKEGARLLNLDMSVWRMWIEIAWEAQGGMVQAGMVQPGQNAVIGVALREGFCMCVTSSWLEVENDSQTSAVMAGGLWVPCMEGYGDVR